MVINIKTIELETGNTQCVSRIIGQYDLVAASNLISSISLIDNAGLNRLSATYQSKPYLRRVK